MSFNTKPGNGRQTVIVIASNNLHKIAEFNTIFFDQKLISASLLFPDFDPEESGKSFLENSLLKAGELYARLESPEGRTICEERYGGIPAVLADDSGIEVDALGGEPGIYSARFGQEETGRRLNSVEQNALLLSKLKGVAAGPGRSARYVCCLTLLMDRQRIFTAQESWEGEIAMQPSKGKGGFGYDPHFSPSGARLYSCRDISRGKEQAQPPRQGG